MQCARQAKPRREDQGSHVELVSLGRNEQLKITEMPNTCLEGECGRAADVCFYPFLSKCLCVSLGFVVVTVVVLN